MNVTSTVEAKGGRVERFIPIPGSHNLRDMGGYRTEDGRELKWGTLFRSGVMARLSDADRVEFRRLGISVIFDLRANHERARRPTQWHHGQETQYYSRDYEMSAGALDEMLRKGSFAPEDATRVVHDAYRVLPFEQAASYRELLRLLVAGRVPLLFNCTAGKDRTGIAAALILFAVGVPRQTIEHDYSLTDLALAGLTDILLADPRYATLAKLPQEQYSPLLKADPDYLAVAFKEIESRHGGLPRYLEAVLGVGLKEIKALREVLLTSDHRVTSERS
jgi:protein-tyrosine phosphatase